MQYKTWQFKCVLKVLTAYLKLFTDVMKLCAILYREEDPDPLTFGPPDPDRLLFSFDSEPTCNNGFMK